MKIILFITLVLVVNTATAQKIINLKVKRMGYVQCHVQSSRGLQDEELGGYGESPNKAKAISGKWSKSTFFLELDPSISLHKIRNKKGETNQLNMYQLYLVNQSDSTISLSATDNYINVRLEVFWKDKWRPIERPDYRSTCGNSYHKVSLKSGEYWQCPVPKYEGNIKTQMRYSLKLEDGTLHSNTFEGSFNRGQLKASRK